mgnify:CR=1 FL=1
MKKIKKKSKKIKAKVKKKVKKKSLFILKKVKKIKSKVKSKRIIKIKKKTKNKKILKKQNLILKIINFQNSLKLKINFKINFSIEKYIQAFFDKIANTIFEYKETKKEEARRLKLEKSEKERLEKINLENDKQISNSFAFRSGNMFVVSNNGEMLANFGSYKPPGSEAGGLPGQYSAADGTTPLPGTGTLAGENTPFFDQPNSPYPLPGSGSNYGAQTRPDFGTYDNPMQPGVSGVEYGDDGRPELEYTPPTKFQYPADQFFDFLRARIQSTSTKILANPFWFKYSN